MAEYGKELAAAGTGERARFSAGRPLAALLLICVATLCGCVQSGYITNICSSADGWVLAFEDDVHHTIWVAERAGVRYVSRGIGGHLALSPDGRHLLTVGHSELWRQWDRALGDRFELIDLKTDRRWRGTGPWSTGASSGLIRLRFDPDGGFTLWSKPRPKSPATKASQPSQPTQTCWRWRPATGFQPVAVPPGDGIPFQWSSNGFDSGRAAIVPIDYDRWNARRQIWVRPDGSTMEICRQNDLPVMIPLTIVTAPTFPINFFWLSLPQYVGQSFEVVWEPKEQLAKIDRLVRARKAAAKRPPVSDRPPSRPVQ